MKIRHLIFSLLAATSLFFGCTKDKVENARMTISVSEMNFERVPSEGQNVTVNSNRKWKVKDLPEWVTVSMNGKEIENEVMPVGETTVTIILGENTSDDREYKLLFNGGNVANKTLSINQAGVPIVYDKISEIKALLGTETTVNIPEGKKIKGTIVSNVSLCNQTSKKNIVVQDETGGIAMRLAENCTFAFGDVVVVDLSNQELTTYNKAYQINNIPSTQLTVKQSATEVIPVEADITKFLNNEYEGTYISLRKVEVPTAKLTNTWVKFSGSDSSHTSINFIVETGEAFVVFSSKYATYGRETVAQGAGTICGVASRNNDEIQLIFGQRSDWEQLTEERFEAYSEEVTIDQAIEMAANKDVTVHGRVIKVVKDGFILNDGTQNSIYIYNGNKLEYTVFENDIVEVKGNISIYGATEIVPYQIRQSEKSIAPTPELKVNELTPAQVASYSGKASVLVTIRGLFIYDSSGPFYNLELEGQSIKGSFKVLDGVDIKGFNGQTVSATGFYLGGTSKYFNVSITSKDDVDDSFLTINPAKTKIKADSTMVKFNISSNKSWTLATTEGYSVEPASGTGDAEITVTFAENTDIAKEKEGTVTVTPTSGKAKAVTFKVVQAKAIDPEGKVLSLSNDEILAGLEATYAKSKVTGFQEIVITGTSTGTWKGNANFTVSGGKVTSNYLWIRNKPAAGIKSPEFKSNISKVVLNLNEKTTASSLTFFVVHSSFDLSKVTTSQYSASTFKDVTYGSVERLKSDPATVEIPISGDTKDFTLVVVGGSAYINSIDIILK